MSSHLFERIALDCFNCGICVKECAFLQEYGTPQKIAVDWLAGRGRKNRQVPFECSLCGLCRAVCPKDLDPSAMFLDMRRELVAKGDGDFREHNTIRSYEKRGSSPLLSWFHFPENCHTVLFPGCALPGSRPLTLTRLFSFLQESIPDIGVALDCCTKPSHDLGNSVHFQTMFRELCRILTSHSVKTVLTVCPNCYRIFKEYGTDLEVRSVYEDLARSGNFSENLQTEITVHDPCGVRFSEEVQQSTRDLLQLQGLKIREMKHNRTKSYCCGEGGAAGFIRPDFAEKWTRKRVNEAGPDQIVSYCAGCTHYLGKEAKTHHLLDLLFFPQAVMQGRQKVSKSPFTYWNRYRLKQTLKKQLPDGISGTRLELRN
ncbi:MAG TPA: (Fe-S)-binding protein [Desulfocapsa sulfexigens]|nr:(Fe-S)-binding protein [Desulfocapsa sulfexigens]